MTDIVEDFGRLSDGESESDSGQGSSENAASGESITGLPHWHMCPIYNTLTAYSESMASIMPAHAMIYEFEIPQVIVGRLIGRYGTFVNKIKLHTGANIIVKRHFTSVTMKRCAVEGLCSEIEDAIRMIRERFPIKRFPYLTLDQVNLQKSISPSTSISLLPSNNKLKLIEGVISDVTLCCTGSVDCIFVQQPTHPTFPALARLHEALRSFYEETVGAPKLLRPFNVGVICVARLSKDEWFRAEVVDMDETEEVTARLVDVGGYVKIPIESLRQIRVDFVTIPFQATECKLAQIKPTDDETKWSTEATNYFNTLCQGQVLQAQVMSSVTTNNITSIYLYKMNGTQVPTFVNRELVEKGFAKWINEPNLPSFEMLSLKELTDC
jgi:A-kinase anchor protein 1